MTLRRGLLAAVALSAIGVGGVGTADAKTLRWASFGDANSLDPHVLNETFTIGFHGNIYEGLIRRDENLEIQPALARDWELVEPTRWRFYLREGVTFHNGNAFNADDVIFTFERILMDGSDMGGKFPSGTEVLRVDDYTVDFITSDPNPILHAEFADIFIMDKEWAEEHDAIEPSDVATGRESYAAFNANGTGAFRVESRETGVRTELVPNDDWWDEPEHNLSRVIFTPISSGSTRVAALLSGEIDMMYPVPVQDLNRVESNPGTSTMTGPELRTIFLGMDQMRDELLYSNIEGENPLQDRRVREAFYRAIDVDAIQQRIMRGQADPSALMLAPILFERADNFERLEHDPDKARKLLAEAGYPEGFEIGMDCPNDRYVNDESICQAVVSMLARIGVDVDLNAQTRAEYFAKVLGYDTSFYLLGWTPSSLDSLNVLRNLINCLDRDATPVRAQFNYGGYCNERVDALTERIAVETDETLRDDMIEEAFALLHEDRGYIPLHQQYLAWGKKDSVDLVQRPDNQFMMFRVRMD